MWEKISLIHITYDFLVFVLHCFALHDNSLLYHTHPGKNSVGPSSMLRSTRGMNTLTQCTGQCRSNNGGPSWCHVWCWGLSSGNACTMPAHINSTSCSHKYVHAREYHTYACENITFLPCI